MAGPMLVLKKVDTFPLPVEIDCPLGSGKLTFDCKVMSKPEFTKLQDRGLTDPEYFAEIVTAVHGAPGATGEELQGQEAMSFVTDGPLSMWLLPAFISALFEQYGDARRKNGQRLPRR